MSEPALELDAVVRRYRQAGGALEILRGASLRLMPGEAVALVGPSGAGKSTLLHVAGLLEAPDGGRVLVDGQDGGRLGDRDRTLLRRRALGFVYQFHHLLPEFSALENVIVPQMIAGRPRRERIEWALKFAGLVERRAARIQELSGGMKRRLTLDVALVHDPRVL
ncbi:MAG: ABC transporter ATP-binding protein, partial [Alphaproteobacteria bacterium]